MQRRPRWLKSLRRELRVQWRDNPRALAGVLVVWLLSSGGLAVSIWHGQWQELRQQATLRGETYRGLLDLRVTSHRVIALDWGHWDQLYRFAGGTDPGFVEREVSQSSIIRDGQTLLIATADGRIRSFPATPLAPALRRCLTERLQRLEQLASAANNRKAFGLYCPAGAQSSLGAATAILATGEGGPPRGWLLHISRLQRPSYNAAINRTFQTIGAELQEAPPQAAATTPIRSISELLKPGHSQALRLTRSPFEQPLRALQSTLLPWLGLNGLALLAAAGILLALRRLRLSQRHNDWRNRSRLRQLRQELPGPLLSQRELLDKLSREAEGLGECWIAALRMTVTMFSGAASRSQAHTRALGQLGERLQHQPGTRALALGEESNLLLVYKPTSPWSPEAELQRLKELLQRLQADLSDTTKLTIQGLITPLDPGHSRQQLADLALVLSGSSSGDEPLLFLADGVARPAARLRQQLQVDFSVSSLIENLREHRFALEPVLALEGADGLERRVDYDEMLFRLPAEMDQQLSVQEVILSLERNRNVHQIDLLMLSKAIELLQDGEAAARKLGINLSAVTLGSHQHFEAVMGQLRAQPAALRQRLVLEVTETAIIEKPELWGRKLEQLRDLGIAIAIDDFGVGFASIAYLFRFQADYLKLDQSYSQRLGDANVDALVDFLLAFTQHNGCQLVLEGIETREQLETWQRRGVRMFQGYLFKPDSRRSAAG